ncbi:MAG: glycosyltransferase [Chitinophagales bacterium]
MNTDKPKKVIVAPLDWGLGHASRCIPIIQQLLNRGVEVLVAGSGSALKVLQREFPQLTYVQLPAYNPVYPANGSMVWKMGAQLPKFINAINKEQLAIERLVAEHKAGLVIADNRYGAYSKKVKSVFITHQLRVLMPNEWKWMEGIVNHFNYKQISKFTECWVPAPPDNPFTELLQFNSTKPPVYVGYLSRLQRRDLPLKYDIVVVCSGPEPQRSIFEELLVKQLSGLNKKAIVVRGRPQEAQKLNRQQGQITIINYLESEEMNEVLCESNIVVCRSGYSMVMDLMQTGGKAVFIPTPGQTEQEYVASVLKAGGIAFSETQQNFNLEKALKESEKYRGFHTFGTEGNLLNKAIDSLL